MTSVDICVCTFRRDSLEETLASLVGQAPAGMHMRVVVADNDEQPARRAAVEALGRKLGLELVYVHAPARNISIARNACLDAAAGAWIAFIDDDEVAAPGWLSELMKASANADVVFGVSKAIYAGQTPRWVVDGDFHSNRMGPRDPSWNGYTANVLINRKFVKEAALRFDEAAGQTGGEDTLFFFEAARCGARFSYSPDAVVTERAEPGRTSLKWLLLRRWRSGQTHAELLRRQQRLGSGTLLAAAKLAFSLGAGLVHLPQRSRAASDLLRAALHAGVISSAFRLRTYREYGGPPA